MLGNQAQIKRMVFTTAVCRKQTPLKRKYYAQSICCGKSDDALRLRLR